MKTLNFDTAAPGVQTNFGGELIDIAFLEHEIKAWLTGRTRRLQRKSEAYYAGEHDIKKRKRQVIGESGALEEAKHLPNNRIVDNQFAIHVDKKKNYLLGKPVTFDTDDKAYGAILAKIFGPQFLYKLDGVGHGAYVQGKHWMFPYIRADGEMDFMTFPASEILPFWTDADHTELDCAVRFYTVLEYEENGDKKNVHKVEVFHGGGIQRFLWDGDSLKPDYDMPTEPYFTVKNGSEDTQGYNWDRIPLVAFKANRLEQPILCRVKCLQDAYNTILSDFANEQQDSPHKTIFVIKNAMGEELGKLRKNLNTWGIIKTGTFEGGETGADTLTVEVNAENYKVILDCLKRSIIENMRSFDAKDERMSNNPNQMNIQSIYSEIDIDANGTVTAFQAAFDQLLWFVNMYLKNKGAGDFTDKSVKVIFNRDILINETEVIKNCTESRGTLSNESILKQHPWVDDPVQEMKRIKKEQEEESQQADVFRNAFVNGRNDPKNGANGDGEQE